MRRTRHTDLSDGEIDQIRNAYLAGYPMASLIRDIPALRMLKSPSDVMWALMDAFWVGLSDVGCVDGWWPPDADGEVSDAALDQFVRDAVEEARSKW